MPMAKYDTNSKITFTAVGAGMDNESPKKGDTRYLPGSWKITETRTWDAAPYTATFRVSKAGTVYSCCYVLSSRNTMAQNGRIQEANLPKKLLLMYHRQLV